MVIICSDEGEGKSSIVSRIHAYRREWNLPSEEDKEHIKQYLLQHVIQDNDVQDTSIVKAASVDQDKYVVTFTYCQVFIIYLAHVFV